MKILFLDMDGVINSQECQTRGLFKTDFPVDPYMAFLVGKIQLDTDCLVVLSSSWRHHDDSVAQINKQLVPIYDCTGNEPYDHTRPPGAENCQRGREIKAWLDANPTVKCNNPTGCPKFTRAMCKGHEIERYAILDDENDMLPEQQEHFFKTSWKKGITDEIAKNITEYLNEKSNIDK